ncbi:MAG: O-antigen ligase family protein [Phormidesmis sp.]
MQSASDSLPAISYSSAHGAGWKGQWLGGVGVSVLLAFSWLPNSYALMVSWPYGLLWQAAFCLLVGWSVWMSRQFSQPLTLLGHRLDWVVWAIALGSGLSTLTAQFPLVAAGNFLLLTSYGVVLYLVVNWARCCEVLKGRLWFALALSGTVTSIISLAFWRPSAAMWTGQDFYSAIRNPFPLGHHNFVGGYCLLMLPLVVGFVLTQTSWRRWLGYGAIALNTLALYASGSRGALLGALALGLIALPLYVIYYSPKTRKHWMVLGLLCLLVSGALASNPRMRSLITFSPSASSTPVSIQQINDGPTKDRLFMLQAGGQIFKTHPLLGVGPGNLARVYNRYRPIETGGGLELVQQLHNTPAQILAELGIVGLGEYLLWLGWLMKIGMALHKNIQDRTDRVLLYSIGASWFAYTVSSLSDYQLENIGIASTLTMTTALLIVLADKHLALSPPALLKVRTRRWISLGLLLYCSILLQFWARVEAGFYLANAADKAVESYNFADADTKWLKASQLMPWDPTYAALSSEQLVDIADQTSDLAQKEMLTKAAIASLKTALKAAPNDPWFNQNLAVLLAKDDPSQAERYIRRTALLFPRSQHHTYYTLGCILLNQQQKQQATTAFVLESLTNATFLSDPIWQSPPFAELLSDVVDRAIAAWQQVLANTAPQSPQYAWLNQQIALVQWWHHRPLSVASPDRLAPLVQAILAIDSDSAKASSLLAQYVETSVNSLTLSRAALLQAWLMPDQRLPKFLESLDATPEEKQAVADNVHTHRDFRKWLTSIHYSAPEKVRYGLAFAYRNQSANDISQILFADGLSVSLLLSELNLFPAPPREFAQLDQKIAEIGAQALSLTWPTK